uniref:CCHC-type domain-containing protein n=1 Tax=Anopheles minimus TaxID=112268 RepID=A0A182WFL5_9DIPT
MTDEDILNNLKNQNVVSVRRFTRKMNNEIVPTNVFLLRVNSTKVPPFIRLGPLQVATRPYYPKPMLCYNCAHYGHTKMSCKAEQTCSNCGTSSHGDCIADSVCCNCKENHSFSRSCAHYKEEEAIIRYKVDNNCTYGEARKMVATAVIPSPVQQRLTYAQQSSQDEKGKEIEMQEIDMNKNINEWAKVCDNCQKVKVNRHMHAPFSRFDLPSGRFGHKHIDIVEPLPLSDNMSYILTVINRYTRCPEAFPIADSTAETVAKTLVQQYIVMVMTCSHGSTAVDDSPHQQL